MTAHIRQATEEDLDAVVAVGHRTWPATYERFAGRAYVEMGLAKWWTRDANEPAVRAGRVIVAEVDGEIVGMASVGPRQDHLVLWKLYVVPEQQGSGLGSQLFDEVVARARGLYPEIQVAYADGNEPAAAFYRSKGFELVEIEHTGHGIPDSVWMRMPLPADEDVLPGSRESS